MAVTAREFGEGLRSFKKHIVKQGRKSGPAYMGYHKYRPIVWSDQLFERDIEPAGIVNCSQALRVGSTLNALDVVLSACNANEGNLLIPAGATITVTLMQGVSEEGTFEEVGPTVCVKAPAAGMEVEPDGLVARFPIGDFDKPCLMVNVEFSGAITGGHVDCSLGYIPR